MTGKEEMVSEIVVCAGPPECIFTGDEAVAAAQAGCPRCKHILVRPDEEDIEFQVKPQ